MNDHICVGGKSYINVQLFTIQTYINFKYQIIINVKFMFQIQAFTFTYNVDKQKHITDIITSTQYLPNVSDNSQMCV